MYRQLVHGDVIRGVFGMGPAQDCIGSGMENILSVGAGKIGGEGNVEGVENGGIVQARTALGERRGGSRAWAVGDFLEGIHRLSRHCGGPMRDAEVPLGPLTHVDVDELIHIGWRTFGLGDDQRFEVLLTATSGRGGGREKMMMSCRVRRSGWR